MRSTITLGSWTILISGLTVAMLAAYGGRGDLVVGGLLHAAAAAATLATMGIGTSRIPVVRGLRPGAPISWLAVAAALQVVAWSLNPVANKTLATRMLSATPSAWDLGETYALMAVVALLSVGLGVRRDVRAVAFRLGLNRPRPDVVALAIALGVATFIAGLFLQQALRLEPNACLQQLRHLAQLGNEAARNGFQRTALAVVVSLGEDLLCRGAVQPRLGLLAGAVLSALLTVYTCDGLPSLGQAYVLVIALFFGVVRAKLGLTASMTTHITYNLLTFAVQGG